MGLFPGSSEGQLLGGGALDECGHAKVSAHMYASPLDGQHGTEGRKREAVGHRLGACFPVLLVLNLNLLSGLF